MWNPVVLTFDLTLTWPLTSLSTIVGVLKIRLVESFRLPFSRLSTTIRSGVRHGGAESASPLAVRVWPKIPAGHGLRRYAKVKVKVSSGHQISSVGRGRCEICFMGHLTHIIQWCSSISDLGHLGCLLGRGKVNVRSNQAKFQSRLFGLKLRFIPFSFPVSVQRYHFHLCQFLELQKSWIFGYV